MEQEGGEWFRGCLFLVGSGCFCINGKKGDRTKVLESRNHGVVFFHI